MSECNLPDRNIEGFQEFSSLIDDIENSKLSVFLLFRGSNNQNGVSWCPDCVKAEPVIKEVFNSLDKSSRTLIQVSVGNRDQWKDPKCPFRTDPRLQLICIPTIIKWKGGRIVDEECCKQDVLKTFFSE